MIQEEIIILDSSDEDEDKLLKSAAKAGSRLSGVQSDNGLHTSVFIASNY